MTSTRAHESAGRESGRGQETAVEAVTRLRATHATGRTRPASWRLEQLAALERLLKEGEPAIAAALEADLGRPANDTYLGDVAPTAAEARHARKHLQRWMRPQRAGLPLSQQPGKAWIEYQPLGVAVIIGPWNYPFYLTLGPLVAAIAAGDCAVLKPSEHTPNAARVLGELVRRHLDTDAFVVLEGGPEVTQEILEQGLDLAFFTGGPEIGKAVMATAAQHLTPVILELGGKCPIYVAEDANIAVAARRIAWTKLLNSGQTCVAPDYVMVERSVLAPFQRALLDELRALSPNGDGGRRLPIVNSRHAARLRGLLEAHGGSVIAGGDIDVDAGRADLTVVLDPDVASPLMTEEIFGPILPLVPVDGLGAALEHIATGSKPLAASVFTEDDAVARRFRDGVSAGAVLTNHVAVHVLAPGLPFGGVGTSGMGAYHGRYGFEAFSHRSSHVSRPTGFDPRIVYPPYNRLTRRVIRALF
ncbi:aldehyde dehydrogenase family protein [Nocardioides sp.]|uniref:aldehyde dehydrogenase family protein n=1 Tax=Nocardioides sp. TaxID=35761 RepID=UPI003514EA81